MNYTETVNNNQSISKASSNFLVIPNTLNGFVNTNTTIEKDSFGYDTIVFYGEVLLSDNDITCDCCSSKMHIHQSYPITIKHLPFGPNHSFIKISRKQMKCSACGKLKMQEIPFKDTNHMITKQLRTMIEDYLSKGTFTNKEISFLTGVNKNVVKEIDKKR